MDEIEALLIVSKTYQEWLKRALEQLENIKEACGTNDPKELGEIIRSINEETQL